MTKGIFYKYNKIIDEYLFAFNCLWLDDEKSSVASMFDTIFILKYSKKQPRF